MTIDTLGSLSAGRTDRAYTAVEPVAAQPAGSRTPATATETTTAVTAKAEAGATSATELKEALGKLNESMREQSLEFSIDEDSRRTVVKVIDVATKEVVRQMPSEDALRIAKALDSASGSSSSSSSSGMLIRQQA